MSEFNIRLRSNYLDGAVDVQVITPNPFLAHDPKRFYESGKKYPVLWLLHGGKETMIDWFTYSTIARQGVWRNCILVAPVAPNSDFLDQPLVWEGYRFFSYFFGELMPFIHNWLPASPAPEDNYLTGHSMGCEAAWRYGLLKPERFSCIVPLGDVPKDYSWLEPLRAKTAVEFRALWENGRIDGGPVSQLLANNICKYETVGKFLDSCENTLARFDEAAAAGKLPKTFFACGRPEEDPEVAGFKKHLEELGIDKTANIHLADHFEQPAKGIVFAEKALEEFFEFAGLKKIGAEHAPYGVGVNPELVDDTVGVTCK